MEAIKKLFNLFVSKYLYVNCIVTLNQFISGLNFWRFSCIDFKTFFFNGRKWSIIIIYFKN